MRFAISAAVVVIAMSWPVFAQDQAKERPLLDAVHQACMADIKQFCADVQPGGGRIVKCLRDNEDKLSKPCTEARAAARAKIERKSSPPMN